MANQPGGEGVSDLEAVGGLAADGWANATPELATADGDETKNGPHGTQEVCAVGLNRPGSSGVRWCCSIAPARHACGPGIVVVFCYPFFSIVEAECPLNKEPLGCYDEWDSIPAIS